MSNQEPSTSQTDDEDQLIVQMTVTLKKPDPKYPGRLIDAGFNSSIELPLKATEGQKQDFVMAWLKLMEAGLRWGN